MAHQAPPQAVDHNLLPFDHNTPFKRREPPNPNWTFGQRIESTPEGRKWMEGEKAGWKTFDAAKEKPGDLYALLLSGVLPRPVAFVSSVSSDGVENIAPFSYFNTVSPYPPIISISVNRAPAEKDTSKNIKATKGFTVNIISEPWVEQANAASMNCPNGVSEWSITGLTKEPSIYVKAPRVKESAFSMECVLNQVIEFCPDNTPSIPSGYLILGTIKYVHVRKDMLNPDKDVVDPDKLKPIARMGDISYTRVTEAFRLPRFDWQKEKEGLETSGLIEGNKEQASL
ncbi:flavoprotein oxygenase [Moniliophthora roreri MCA 2997]|uniref:Flavoprotein oxygenase n=2 Tax=Moniliophthora roreri TaxID=221103 RepID=V2XIL0_MONRO|nr:flavoprotein oxygenase [Moniliophthora roreri MCA 2997]KAI3613685.1 flavoprotein oxygenase [Moniliophthora roreri]